MSNILPIVNSIALCSMRIHASKNVGVHGIALSVRKVDSKPDNIIKQPALTLAGYPEYIEGNNNTATTRQSAKYNYEPIIMYD